MKIAIIGQQDFGKAVLEAFLKRGDDVTAVFCAPEKAGARPDALRRRPKPSASPGPPLRLAPGPRSGAGDGGPRRRHRHHGLRAPVRAPGLREDPAARHDPVSSVALAEISRAEVDQLANHPGDTETGLTIFRPDRRTRRGPGRPTEDDADRARRHARLGLLRSPVPDGRASPARGGRSRSWRGDTGGDRTGRVTGELRGLVPPRRGEDRLGEPSTTSTTSFVDAIRRRAPGPPSTARPPDLRRSQDSLSARSPRCSGKVGDISEVTAGDLPDHRARGPIEVLKAKLADGKKVDAGELAQATGLAADTLLGG